MPATGTIHRHPVGLGFRHGPGPAEPHPLKLRDADLANLPGQAPNVPLLADRAYDLETFTTALLAPRRLAACPVKEVPHGCCEVTQRLLLHHVTAGGQPC